MDLSSLLEVQVNEMKMEINTKKKDEHDIKTRTRNFRTSDCNSIASNSNLSINRIDNVSITSTDRIASTISAVSTISQEESTFYNIVFKDIATVRFCKIHCTACNIHIGSAPAAIHNMCEHPVLHTLLCARCREFYGDGTFEQGDDATDMFCRWCANGGNLYCCSYCSNTFCSKCIKRNFSSIIRKKIEADEKWKCFVCNPRDLYGARALHWALLQHVQTVTRILKNDKKISAKELEDKMNLDESQCCMRRNKRKYRRTESDSEEEDKTYVPDTNELNMKRKVKKFKMNRYSNPNGNVKQIQSHTKLLIPIKPAPTLSTVTIQTLKSELSQSKIEHNKQIVNSSENLILPSPSVINTDSSSLPGYSDSGVQSSSFYYPFMNNAGSSTFVQISSAVKPVTQITLSSLPSQPTSQSSTSQLPLPNAMVSIPNPVRKRGRPRLLPKTKTSNVTVTNVIELDSDSDEPKVVEQQNDSIINTDITNICSNKVVPVALTWENSDNNNVEQPLKEMCASVKKDPSFSEIMSPHIQELDKILCDVKERVCLLFNSFNAIQDVELTAQQKVKHFYRYMHNTVFQLSHINDRVVREYNHWTNSRKTNTDASFAVDKNASVIQNIEIPVDMICINDSETDSDCEKSEYQIKEPSDLVKSNNIIKDLLFFKKDVVHRSVGDDTTLLHSDKAIQVCDDVPCYEKHIDYSVINRFGSKRNDTDDILKPMIKRQENFSKYEEQFINYLQHIENHGIEIEDAEELIDLDELPSQEPKEITSSPNIDLCISDKEKNNEQERNTESCINSLFKDDKIDASPNAIHKDNITNKSNIDIKVVEKKLQKTNNHPIEKKAISIMSNNDTSSSQNSKTTSIKMTALGNDCTIIDD